MSADGSAPRAAPDLTALLGSRICHDLISPIGAIGNGVELLSMSGHAHSPEIALITESVENANARIRFFRVAFGAAAPGQAVALTEVRQILSDIGRAGRHSYRWGPEDDLDRARVKLAFLLLQCLESSMPFGGSIQVMASGGAWVLQGDAERMKPDPALWALLVDPVPETELTPAHVHFALVADAARQAGRTVLTELGDQRITVTI